VKDYDIAHAIAISAELAVVGAVRREDVPVTATTVRVIYEYPDGIKFYTWIELGVFKVTKHGCDPVKRICY
ncbi:hypothetical protein L0244_09760, partial [bacterium]|nr:hypothetical protein [bacterium]